MAQARFTLEDYRAALLALLPLGRAWPKGPDSVQWRTMGALAQGLVRLDARAQTLLQDAFPGSTLELLPEWEATLGLPDPCEGEDQTLQQRRAQVVAKLSIGGGQSVTYYVGVLERLGYQGASIEQFAPFRADVNAADAPIYGEDWIHVWRVTIPDLRIFYFSADVSAADEALLTLSNDVVTCILEALKPAHTTILYQTAGGSLAFAFAENSGLLPAL